MPNPKNTPSFTTRQRAELAELAELERIIDDAAGQLDVRIAGASSVGERRFPLYVITLGNPSPEVPAVGYFGGVHGLERIGAEVVLVYLRSLVARLRWDAMLHRQLESVRLVFMPLVNPGGTWRGTRANPEDVDLMRNAPLDSRERVPFLLGGQRITRLLPWYRGRADAPMELESQALCDVVTQELLTREFSISLDCHSGFGVRDRIWFPYAHTALPIEHLAEIHALKTIFDDTYSHHSYQIEPQSHQYFTHGDLWDYLYLRAQRGAGDQAPRIFLPLTLEMGSWMWVKKNPRQLFSRHGIFNPLIEHRQQRVLRRHLSLLDFLGRAAAGYRRWLPDANGRVHHRESALAAWYRDRNRPSTS